MNSTQLITLKTHFPFRVNYSWRRRGRRRQNRRQNHHFLGGRRNPRSADSPRSLALPAPTSRRSVHRGGAPDSDGRHVYPRRSRFPSPLPPLRSRSRGDHPRFPRSRSPSPPPRVPEAPLHLDLSSSAPPVAAEVPRPTRGEPLRAEGARRGSGGRDTWGDDGGAH